MKKKIRVEYGVLKGWGRDDLLFIGCDEKGKEMKQMITLYPIHLNGDLKNLVEVRFRTYTNTPRAEIELVDIEKILILKVEHEVL